MGIRNLTKFYTVFSLSLLSLTSLHAQFLATQAGAWNIGTTWNMTTCASGCVAGVDYPGSLDDAYTQGFKITISGSSFAVNNLYVYYNVVDGLKKTGLGTTTLTINGELAAYTNSPSTDYAIPTVAVINPNFNITFTGNANGGLPNSPYVIYPSAWSSVSPLKTLVFNPPSSLTTLGIGDLGIINSGSLTVQNGTLEVDGSLQSATAATTGTITINSGATLFVNTGNIFGNSGAASTFPTITVNGTLTSSSNSTSYINGAAFNLNSGSTLNVGFNGANQTEGWWYQSNRPTTFSVNALSTIEFNASTNQNIYSTTYGNLILDASAACTKSLSGAGSTSISGDFTINSSNVSFNTSSQISIGGNVTTHAAFSPTGLITLNGIAAQVLDAVGGSFNFGGGLKISKSSGTASISDNIIISNGLTINTGTFDFSTNQVTLSGNLTNNATVTPSSGTLAIAGTTSITGSSATSLNNLTINSGGNLTAPSTLNIAGNFTNNGTFSNNSGTVTFNGNSAQSIAGSTTISFNNVNNSNTAGGVSVNSNVDLNGTLTLTSTSAVFDADGAGSGVFTVKSTAVNAGGRIAALPQTSNFSGNVTIERFINGPDDWRYLSMPITNGNVASWKTYFPVTGSFSDPSPAGVNGVVSSSAASIYSYNATTGAYLAIGTGGSTASTALSNTVGYTAYTYLSTDFTLAVRGTIGKGNISLTLANGGSGVNAGYNLIPNPYPSAIDWDNITIPGNLSSSMSLRTGNNTFSSYVQGGAATNPPFTGWTGEIASGQSLWVKSTGATSLSLTEAAKTSNAYQFLRTAAPPSNLVRITLLASGQKDEAIIWFQNNATDSVDNAFDAPKRKNGNYVSSLASNDYLNISSYIRSASVDFAINGIAPISCLKSVSLKVEDTPVGTYKLMFTELSSFNLGYNLVLIDHFLGKQIPLSDSLQYSFDVTSDANSFGDLRFEIQFSPPLINTAVPVINVLNACDPDNVQVSISSQAGINYQFSISGTPVSTIVTGTGQKITALIDRSKLTTGSNSLDVTAGTAGGCSSTTFSNAFQYLLNSLPNLPRVASDTICRSFKANLFAYGAPPSGGYLWYDSINSATPISGINGGAYQTDTLSSTTMFYVASFNADGCQSSKVPVVATVIPAVKAVINVNGFTLISNSTTGNQWLLNGLPVSGATSQQYQVAQFGSYSLEVSNGYCSNTSDEVIMTVTGIEKTSDGIKAYPNPVKDQLNLDIPVQFDEVRIFDSQGRIMETIKPSLDFAAPSSLQIDLSNYSRGLYLINLTAGTKNYSVKIIKH